MKTSICPICGKEYQHTRKQTYCKNDHYKNCAVCGKEFLVPYEKLCDYNNIVNCGSKECARAKRSASMKATAKMMPKGWNASKTLYHKTCANCGKEFETSNPSQIYCNDAHYKECVICGSKFEVPNDMLGSASARKTCSAVCDRKYRENQTFLKYGVNNYSQTQEWKDRTAKKKEETDARRRATNLARYGVERKSQSAEWKIAQMRDPSKAEALKAFTENPEQFLSNLGFIPNISQLSDILGINVNSVHDSIYRNNLVHLIRKR